MVGLRHICGSAWAGSRQGAAARSLLAASLIASLLTGDGGSAFAKQPGTVHCYGGWCHRVNTVEEMRGLVGRRGIVKASYYDDCRKDRFNTCGLTSSGAVFEPHMPDNAASPIFPDGSVLLAFNPKSHKAVIVRVNSAGPYRGDRTLDVSRATAEALGFKERGVTDLMIAILQSPNEEEARYKKLRIYPKVPGYIGSFATFDEAHDEAVRRLPPKAGEKYAASDAKIGIRPQDMVQAALPEETVLAQVSGKTITVVAQPAGSVIAAVEPQALAGVAVKDVESVDVAVPGSPLLERLGSFIIAARQAARPETAASISKPDMPISERLWTFIAEAKRQARTSAPSPSLMLSQVDEIGLSPPQEH